MDLSHGELVIALTTLFFLVGIFCGYCIFFNPQPPVFKIYLNKKEKQPQNPLTKIAQQLKEFDH